MTSETNWPVANGILKDPVWERLVIRGQGRPVDAGIAENVINLFLVKGRYDAHAAGNTQSRDWIRLARTNFGHL
ncbi:hypothetical protein P7H12_10700 [Paenibacillus larvae]|nr:hypothetical protein [Paenibacillus larvae]MDT2263971.1 hypothetical protein [Paenibacillus larvae]